VRTELHFHLLPGVDDGPRDDGEAVELARLAVADGTARVVATPHVRHLQISELPSRTKELQARLYEAGVGLEIRGSGELSPDDVARLGDDELEVLALGPPGRRWLLVEAPLEPIEPDLAAAASEVRERGFGVLIAHPERSPATPSADVREQVARGARIQINASSLSGAHGPETERAALEVARSGLPFVVASDAHSPSRPPLLTEGARALAAAGLDAAAIRGAVDSGPEQLLADGLPATARVAGWPSRAGSRSDARTRG
jgi:protein-tyrosine phosphatase